MSSHSSSPSPPPPPPVPAPPPLSQNGAKRSGDTAQLTDNERPLPPSRSPSFDFKRLRRTKPFPRLAPEHSADRFIPNNSPARTASAQIKLAQHTSKPPSSHSSNVTSATPFSHASTSVPSVSSSHELAPSDRHVTVGSKMSKADPTKEYEKRVAEVFGVKLDGHMLDLTESSSSSRGSRSTDNPSVSNQIETGDDLRDRYNRPTSTDNPGKQTRRTIPKTPERALDAPNLADDFYLNPLDWSSKNILAVALRHEIYLWDSANGSVKRFLRLRTSNDRVTAVSFSPDGVYLAVSTEQGKCEVWRVREGGEEEDEDMEEEQEHQRRRRRGILFSFKHRSRISVLTWSTVYTDTLPTHSLRRAHTYTLAAGSRDGKILYIPEIPSENPHATTGAGTSSASASAHPRAFVAHVFTIDTPHTAEICGLRFGIGGLQLASGGNDNYVCIFDVRSFSALTRRSRVGSGSAPSASGEAMPTNGSHAGGITPFLASKEVVGIDSEIHSELIHGIKPRFIKTEHQAAVKAVAWCPWERNLLATGGGTHDRIIRFYDTRSGNLLRTITTPSQVTALIWSPLYREILSTHGFSPFSPPVNPNHPGSQSDSIFQNAICIHAYPSLATLAIIPAHDTRVLYTALSPDGQKVVTGAGDECLKFWKVWARDKEGSGGPGNGFLKLKGQDGASGMGEMIR